MAQKYRGSKTHYVDIAIRGNDTLGIGIDYAVHPQQNAGYLLVRFVAHGPNLSPDSFSHLVLRDTAQFLKVGEDETQAEVFKGVRLNKVPVKLFEPPIYAHEVSQYADKFDLWPLLTDWIVTQVTAEGFILTVDLQDEIKALLTPPVPPVTEEPVTCLYEFPNLVEVKAAYQAKATLAAEEVEEKDDDDGDEGPVKKDWLN